MLMEEPVRDEDIKRCQEEAAAQAESRGHSLGAWKWDGHGYWRAWCKNRNCFAFVWVSWQNPQYGGTANLRDCCGLDSAI